MVISNAETGRNLSAAFQYPFLELGVDFKATHDSTNLALIKNPAIPLDKKLAIINGLSPEVFSSEEDKLQADEERIGNFLRCATDLYKNPDTPKEIKTVLFTKLTPDLLAGLIPDSVKNRWREESAEALLHAYCTFVTIDRLFDEDQAASLHRQLAEDMIWARTLDQHLEQVSGQIVQEGRGSVVYLGCRGAEATQIVAQRAFLDACDQMSARGVLAPYYRDHVLTTDLRGTHPGLYTVEETFAELYRVKGGPRGNGRELPVKGKVWGDEVSVYPGKPQVGSHIAPASGYANQIRLRTIQIEGIVYPKPELADAYRNIQIEGCLEGALLLSLGDGALPHLEQVLEKQAVDHVPAINFVQNNKVAIGVEEKEVSVGQIERKGHGRGIPGVSIEALDIDGLYMAMRFATLRALFDGGPIIIEAKTKRLGAHSSQHGDPETARLTGQTQDILQSQIERLPEGEQKEVILDFLKNELFGATQNDNQIRLAARLKNILQKEVLDETATTHLLQLLDSIVDPLATHLNYLLSWGDITDEDVVIWQQQAEKEIAEIQEKVIDRSRPRPKPEEALWFNRMPDTPMLELPSSSEKVTMTGAEAVRRAIAESMRRNPNLIVVGQDVRKGPGIHNRQIRQEGGYFGELAGLWEEFGKRPYRVHNISIAESLNTAYYMGMATTPTTAEALERATRILISNGFADYAIQAFEPFLVNGSLFYTSGNMTIPITVLMPEAASPGAGTGHSHTIESTANQTPSSVDLLSITSPEMAYKCLNYQLRFGNNPCIMMIDRGIFNKAEEFVLGTGYFEPGTARLVKDGEDLQFITYGPMTNTVLDSIGNRDGIGVLDLAYIRPYPRDDVASFLSRGHGPIVLISQEPKSQAFTAQIRAFMEEDDVTREHIRGREIVRVGGADVPAPLCDGNLLKAIIPTRKTIEEIIQKYSPLR